MGGWTICRLLRESGCVGVLERLSFTVVCVCLFGCG